MDHWIQILSVSPLRLESFSIKYRAEFKPCQERSACGSISEAVIFLNHDDEIKGLPRSVDGIQIRQKCHRLHFLHATGWQEPENTAIGAYVLHFADGKRQEVPILYGEELRDFNFNGDAKDVRSAKVAWMGQHSTRDHARLFIRTWENPHPEIEIEALDFASKMTKCAPFLVAITAE